MESAELAKQKAMASRYRVRSISFPARPHPCTLRADEELSKLKIWEASTPSTSASICTGLLGLEDLYMTMDDLLSMPSTLQILSRQQNKRCVEESLDGSIKILDVCGVSRDIVFQMKENILSLQSAIRRRKGDSSIECSIARYTCFRKKMNKDAKKLITALKQMDNKFEALQLWYEDDDHLSAVVRVLREVTAVTKSVFQSLLSFLAVPVSKSKASRWSLVAKLMNKGVVACEEDSGDNVNELLSADAALCNLRDYNSSEAGNDDSKKIQAAQEKMEALETAIASMECSLESLFRRIIKSRAFLLNVISH